MYSNFASVRTRSRGILSRFAMAIALAGGAVVASSAVAPAAYAQDYSRDFVKAYQPVAEMVSGESPDFAAARAQFESVAAAVKNDDDRQAAGNLALQIGNQLSDQAFQRRGLEMMLASGKVAPEQVGQFQFFVGNLAFNAEDWAAARTALQAAIDAGYTENDPRGLLIESYFQEGNTKAGVDYTINAANALVEAGRPAPEQWLLRSLQAAYDEEMTSEALELSKVLILANPTQKNWVNGLQVVDALNQLDPQAKLDLLRLMRETDAMTRRAEFVRYIENADPRIMSNEVLPVLNAGVDAGHFATTDDYYVEVKSIVDTRASQDRANPDATASEGLSGDAIDAMAAGDVLWSIGNYAKAEELYKAALDKGGDRATALTRLGMAQTKQGNYAAAVESFGQVEGERAPVAEMWATYARTKMG